MEQSAYTPGPWRVSRGAQADAFAIEAATKTVAHVKVLREARANAALIAASPALLAVALKIVVIGSVLPNDVREELESAIRQALP
jgi:hypothetical protein